MSPVAAPGDKVGVGFRVIDMSILQLQSNYDKFNTNLSFHTSLGFKRWKEVLMKDSDPQWHIRGTEKCQWKEKVMAFVCFNQ